MIQGTLLIATTWAASTSYIPFYPGMINAQDFDYNSHAGDGIFATTACVDGIWEIQLQEEKYVEYLRDTNDMSAYNALNANLIGAGIDQPVAGTGGLHNQDAPIEGLGSSRGIGDGGMGGNAFYPGTSLNVTVRRLKALRSNDRSGIQVNRALYKGNKLVFRYLSVGELVRPL